MQSTRVAHRLILAVPVRGVTLRYMGDSSKAADNPTLSQLVELEAVVRPVR